MNAPWYDIVLKHTSAPQAVDLKNQIVEDGLILDKDFEWRWTQSVWDEMTGVTPSQTKFSFCEEKMAVFYQLKWQIST